VITPLKLKRLKIAKYQKITIEVNVGRALF
jgi:hypothetical protein